jgi:hypothetical protein
VEELRGLELGWMRYKLLKFIGLTRTKRIFKLFWIFYDEEGVENILIGSKVVLIYLGIFWK